MSGTPSSFDDILADVARHPGFLTGIIASADGLPIARRLPIDVDPLRFSAAAAILVSTAQRTLQLLGVGPADTIIVKGRRALVVGGPAGPEAGILLAFRKDVEIVQALDQLQQASRQVEEFVREKRF